LIRNLLTGGVVGGIVGVLIAVWFCLNGMTGVTGFWMIMPFCGVVCMLAGGIVGIVGTFAGGFKRAAKEKNVGFWKGVKTVAAKEWRGCGVWCHRGVKAGWVAGVFAGLVLNSLLIMYFGDSVIETDAAVTAGAGCFLILAALYFIGAVGGGVTGIVVGAVAGRVIKEEWVTGFQKALEIFTYTAGGVFITCVYLTAVYGWAKL